MTIYGFAGRGGELIDRFLDLLGVDAVVDPQRWFNYGFMVAGAIGCLKSFA